MSRTRWENPVDLLIAVIVGAVALVVYTLGLTPTVPFWDSGEYIATSYVLGIPHPPATPLYVLLGRVFTLFPIASIAERVNFLSALPSAVAVSLTTLITARILADCGRPFGEGAEWPPRPTWIGRFGGILAGGVMAFSYTFWTNAIEAEVYALSSMVMVLSVYLMLKWRDIRHSTHERSHAANNIVVLVFYLLALSIAFHMGAFMVLLPLVLFFLADYYDDLGDGRFLLSAGLLVVLSFFLGFDAVRIVITLAVAAVLLVVNGEIVGSRNLLSLIAIIGALAIGGVMMSRTNPVFAAILVAVLAAGVFWAFGHRLVHNNLGFWVGVVFVLGVSVHIFLPIRAGLDPPINEADPSTLENFWKVLSRDQYKPEPPWNFRAGAYDKFVTHFWNYWEPQYFAGSRFFWAVPFLLGIWGAFVNAWRSRRTFVLVAFLLLVSSLGLIWHLNFKADEVRERDYFFVALFHFFAVWIGIGGAGLVYLVREAVGPQAALRPIVGPAMAALLLLLPIGQLRAGWFEHDRSRFTVARDYAYNMLAPLKPNAILFTNGDNDTFPLWYLQEVEGIRKDVRVANLSLLNTDWYIKQLRDIEPTVPITWSDESVDGLEFLWDRATERVVSIKDQAVNHILTVNQWQRPVYIAVTVPDLMGLDDYLRMEGLTWEIEPEPTNDEIDAARVRDILENQFSWGGLLDESGRLDRTVFRDKNSMKLAQNYAAAYVRLGIHYEQESRRLEDAGDRAGSDGAMREAIAMVKRAEQFKEGFSVQSIAVGSMHHALGEYAVAESVYTDLLSVVETSSDHIIYVPELRARRAESRFGLEDYAGALEDYSNLVALMPDAWEAYEGIARAYLGLGRDADASKTIETWLRDHPGHESALRWRDTLRNGGLDAARSPGEDLP